MTSNKFQNTAERLLVRIGLAERIITFAAFSLLIAVIFGDVLMREITGSGVHWARQAGVYANVFIVMFGFGVASAGGAHLRPRFADGWLPARFDPVMVRLQDGLMAGFCLCFALIAIVVVKDSYLLSERSVVLRILIWPFQAVIPIVFVIASLRHSLYAVFPGLRPAESGGAATGADRVPRHTDQKNAAGPDQEIGGGRS